MRQVRDKINRKLRYGVRRLIRSQALRRVFLLLLIIGCLVRCALMMFRVLFFVIAALFIAFAASWLSAQDGVTSITWLGYHAEVESSALVVAIALLCVAGIIIDRLVRALVRWPSLMSAGWQMRRRAKGENALSLGFVALAAGDHRAAHKQARRAEKLLDKGILTDLLVAQSSYASGDSKAASRYFKKLASDPKQPISDSLALCDFTNKMRHAHQRHYQRQKSLCH